MKESVRKKLNAYIFFCFTEEEKHRYNIFNMRWLFHRFAVSRSEQAPGSEFHPRDESDKIDCGFLGPSLCNKKVNELLVSNVAPQMKEIIMIENKLSFFFSEISMKFEICVLFSGSKQPEKIIFERNSKLDFLPQVSCRLWFYFSCWL